jgi:hypothetical protein
MVFGVIVDVDSYIYMYIFLLCPSYGGVGGQNLSSAKIEPQSNRVPKKKGVLRLPFLPLLLLGYFLYPILELMLSIPI